MLVYCAMFISFAAATSAKSRPLTIACRVSHRVTDAPNVVDFAVVTPDPQGPIGVFRPIDNRATGCLLGCGRCGHGSSRRSSLRGLCVFCHNSFPSTNSVASRTVRFFLAHASVVVKYNVRQSLRILYAFPPSVVLMVGRDRKLSPANISCVGQ